MMRPETPGREYQQSVIEVGDDSIDSINKVLVVEQTKPYLLNCPSVGLKPLLWGLYGHPAPAPARVSQQGNMALDNIPFDNEQLPY